MVMIDAISRLVPGVLHNDISAETESFHGNLLEYPQYSRLLSGMTKRYLRYSCQAIRKR
mgnify:CR=1 FL=1